MIPYFEIPSIPLVGPFQIHPFGVLVGTGVLLGARYTLKLATRKGISHEEMNNAIWWTCVVGFVVSHMFDVIFYRPDLLQKEGILALFKVWEGISSYGGFLGGWLGLWIHSRLNKTPIMPKVDILLQGLVVGWIFGRLGCTVVHDHPGKLTDFFLAVNYPMGPRHNLGFYEFLYTLLIIGPAMLWYQKKKPATGKMTAFICLVYAPVRFGLDFLRASDQMHSDPRYLGLTAAQYVSIGVVIFALVFLLRKTHSNKGTS